MSGDILVRPADLDEHSARAWDVIAGQLNRAPTLFDDLAIEAAARAWGRWKALELRLAELAGGDRASVEVSKGKVSALRKSADAAFKEFRAIAAEYGFAPVSTEAPAPTTDLFGLPIRPGKGMRGRPQYMPTLEDRNRVKLLLAVGWSVDRIASALEVTAPTVRKHFRAELKERYEMRDRLDARQLDLAMQAANRGNVAALKVLAELIEKQDAMRAEARLGRPDEAEEEAEEEAPAPIGKKERRAQDALQGEAALEAEIAAEIAKSKGGGNVH